MPWIIGVDEAGYGPNLGPFVMTAVAARVEKLSIGLWEQLVQSVRRAADPADERILVADSKLVYSPQQGLAELERGVLNLTGAADCLGSYLDRYFPCSVAELREECWFTGTTSLPHACEASHTIRSVGTICFEVAGVVVCPRRFNELLDAHDSKGGVLSHSLTTLLQRFSRLGGAEDALGFFVDKHGGRNTYSAMLQNAFPDGMVVAHCENRLRSAYDVLGLDYPLRITFEPRADQAHFCVALASMVSKYVRELAMAEFNAYWRQYMPKLKATAGYPGDSQRFLKDIEPVVKKLKMPMDGLWRRR